MEWKRMEGKDRKGKERKGKERKGNIDVILSKKVLEAATRNFVYFAKTFGKTRWRRQTETRDVFLIVYLKGITLLHLPNFSSCLHEVDLEGTLDN